MLSTVIIGTDPRMTNLLLQVCAEFASICVYKTIPSAVDCYEITSALNRYGPDIAFLVVSDADVAEAEGSLPQLRDVIVAHPGTALVLVSSSSEAVWLHHRSLGPAVAAALVGPFGAEDFQKVILTAMERKPAPTQRRGNLLAVLPSKPGSGASTVAVNLAGAMAGQFARKTLLIEWDFYSGSLPVLLNLEPPQFAAHGVGDPNLLTDAAWPRGVSTACGVDVLAATPSTRGDTGSLWDYHRLLSFARERYDVVVVDLRDVVDEVSSVVVGDADRAYLVNTPEPASLSLVARRLRELASEGVRQDHIESVLNRHASDDQSAGDLGAVIRRTFRAVLPEDTRAVKDAVRGCRLVSPKSAFGREITRLAQTFLKSVNPELPPSPAPRSLRRLVSNAFGL